MTMTLLTRILLRGVRAYQSAMAWRVSVCRYVPSCSSYAVEALEVHGARRGTWLAARRLLRCHPWAPTGWDPVPSSPDRPQNPQSLQNEVVTRV